MTLRLAIAGFGKIATTRHVPAIAEVGGVELVAIADPLAKSADVPHFPSLDRLLKEGPDIDAVTLCTPPQVRGAQALLALEARKHVMLEKPPGATVSEIAPLVAAADRLVERVQARMKGADKSDKPCKPDDLTVVLFRPHKPR